MNQNGILLESLLLVLVVIIGGTTISNSRLASQGSFTETTRDNYDLTTKWQNARFLLEQETSNWVIEQILANQSCQYSQAQPNLDQALNNFNNAESNIECTASLGKLESDKNLSIRLSCRQYNPNGESTVFAKDFNIAKHIESNGSPPKCNIRIRDLQSGKTDFEIGSLRGCFIEPGTNSINEGIPNWFKIQYRLFAAGKTQSIKSVNCGTDKTRFTKTRDCLEDIDGYCAGYCDGYSPGDFAVTATLDDGEALVQCEPQDLTVRDVQPLCYIEPVRAEIRKDESDLFTVFYENFSEAPSNPQLDCGANSGASGTIQNCGNGACDGSCGPYPNPGNFSVSLKLDNGAEQITCAPDQSLRVNQRNPSCSLAVTSPIFQGESTPVTVNYQDFLVTPLKPGVSDIGCGASGANYTPGSDCGPGSSGSCTGGTCGPYGNTGTFTVTGKLVDNGQQITCSSTDVTVQQAQLPTELVHYDFESQSGGKYKNLVNGLYELTITDTFETRFGIGKNVNFKGNNSYLVSTNNLDLANKSFSISLWMNPWHSSEYDAALFTLCPQEEYAKCIHWYYHNNQWDHGDIDMRFWGNEFGTMNQEVLPGKWHHVVFTYDQPSSTGKLYIDKAMVAQKTDLVPFTGMAAKYAIGAFRHEGPPPSYSNFYRGKMDEFRVFENALNQQQIDYLYNITAPSPPSGDPIAEWLFESLVGETIEDSTPNKLDFVKMNSASIGTGKVNNGLVLNNSTQDSVETDFVPLDNRNYSIAFWAKPDADASSSVLVSECEYQRDGNCLHIGYDPWPGKLWFGYWGNDLDTQWNEFLVSRNVWTHLGLVYDNSTQKRTIFVNGVQVAQDSGAITPLGAQFGTFCVGRLCMNGWDYFKGKIDQLHVFSHALSQAEIERIINSEGGRYCQELDIQRPNLYVYHKANGSAIDEMGNNNGQLMGGTAFESNGCQGLNQAYKLDGINDYVRMDSIYYLGANDYSTVRAWIKTSQSGIGTIIEQFGGSNPSDIERVGLYVNKTTGKASWQSQSDSTTCTATSTTTVTDGAWHLIVARQDPGNNEITIFVDGIKEATASTTDCTYGASEVNTATIGGGKTVYTDPNPNTNWFNGLIDDFAVWNGARTDNEIKAMQ